MRINLLNVPPGFICGRLRTFARDEQGQDLVEYVLLLAFVCLAGAAAFIGMGNTTKGLWTTVNSRLAAANQTTS